MSAAGNDALVRKIFEAFSRREGLALRGLFAADAIWTVPGAGVMAGVYRGREEIFRFLGRLPKETGGTYGSELVDSVIAFQKVQGIERDGVAGPDVWRRLANPRIPQPRYTSPADHLEVDKTHQVLYVVRNSRIAAILPTSKLSDAVLIAVRRP